MLGKINGPDQAPVETAADKTGEATASSPLAARHRVASAIRESVAFTQIVSVMMRSKQYRKHTLGDIEWLVLPPLMSGQFRIADASTKKDGPRFPAAVALWASVSPEVDKRLSEKLDEPIRLDPAEWKSGDNLWLIDVIGDARVVPILLKRLQNSTFKNKKVKLRTRDKDGKLVVSMLRPAENNSSAG